MKVHQVGSNSVNSPNYPSRINSNRTDSVNFGKTALVTYNEPELLQIFRHFAAQVGAVVDTNFRVLKLSSNKALAALDSPSWATKHVQNLENVASKNLKGEANIAELRSVTPVEDFLEISITTPAEAKKAVNQLYGDNSAWFVQVPPTEQPLSQVVAELTPPQVYSSERTRYELRYGAGNFTKSG